MTTRVINVDDKNDLENYFTPEEKQELHFIKSV